MLLFSLTISAILLVVVNLIALSRKGTGVGRASLCSLAAGFVLFCCTGALPLPLNGLLVAAAGAVCWAARAGSWCLPSP